MTMVWRTTSSRQSPSPPTSWILLIRSCSSFVTEVTDWLREEGISFDPRKCEIPESPSSSSSLTSTLRSLHVFALEQQSRRPSCSSESTPLPPVLLHVIPSPTSLQDCLPPNVTRNMTMYGIEKDGYRLLDNNNNNNDTDFFHSPMRNSPAIIHLHQDVWTHARTMPIVKARLLCRLGISVASRVYARQTIVRRIANAMAQTFLIQNHHGGATKARYSYGLFCTKQNHNHDNTKKQNENEELVAVATFSNRRHFYRNGHKFRSHELIRYCSKRDGFVVGGISKLVSRFIQEQSPDDIVTLVDYDWGTTGSWHSIGFRTCAVLPPRIMVVGTDGKRRHLIGNEIQNNCDEKYDCNVRYDRIGLPPPVLEELSTLDKYEAAIQCLANHGFYPIYDAGSERLIRIIREDIPFDGMEATWNTQETSVSTQNHSNNAGINSLLRYTIRACGFPAPS